MTNIQFRSVIITMHPDNVRVIIKRRDPLGIIATSNEYPYESITESSRRRLSEIMNTSDWYFMFASFNKELTEHSLIGRS